MCVYILRMCVCVRACVCMRVHACVCVFCVCVCISCVFVCVRLPIAATVFFFFLSLQVCMATGHHTMDALENTLMANGALQSHLAK